MALDKTAKGVGGKVCDVLIIDVLIIIIKFF